MRIAQIMLARRFGGAERSFVDLTRALAARGHDVLAICDQRALAMTYLHGEAHIETHGLICHGSWDVRTVATIRRALEQFQPDLLQAHLARAAHLGGRAAHALGLPTVAKTHNLVKLKYYRDIDMLVPTTAAQESYLLAHGVPAPAMTRIPNFSAVTPVSTIVPHALTPPYRLKALGRFVHKKGFDLLIQAVALLHAEGHAVSLDLVGEGPEHDVLHALSERLGMAEHVRIGKWVDDVIGFLRDGDLFVLPSRDEPFGIVVLEAMAAGVPILATRTEGPLEILGDNAGYLTGAPNAEVLASAIHGALFAPDRIARAGAALRRFRTCYSTAPVVQRYLELYQRMIAADAS